MIKYILYWYLITRLFMCLYTATRREDVISKIRIIMEKSKGKMLNNNIMIITVFIALAIPIHGFIIFKLVRYVSHWETIERSYKKL